MGIPQIDQNYLISTLSELLNIASPTGYTRAAIEFLEEKLSAFPQVELRRTKKGSLLAVLPGQKDDAPRAISSHVDTLGAMVKEIKPNGRLILTVLGGIVWNFVEGEGVIVFAAGGKKIRGSLLLSKASTHVYGKDVVETKREADNMEVRLDERTSNPEETRALGIEVGDFVAFDTRLEINNGFIRSRYLDDKACVACSLAAIKALHDSGKTPVQKTYFYFTTYEEVGHGGADGIPSDTAELLVTDMAAVGQGQTSDEFHVTICVKDSSGPYDHEMSQKLRKLADENQIDYKVDIYPYYGSDGSAYWRSGGDAVVALIGPGVDASHNYERTHVDALLATTNWDLAFLLGE